MAGILVVVLLVLLLPLILSIMALVKVSDLHRELYVLRAQVNRLTSPHQPPTTTHAPVLDTPAL